jgi:hypothetical protein
VYSIEQCERDFERYVAGLYNGTPTRCGEIVAEVPWVHKGCYFKKEEIPELTHKIRATLDAKLWFDKHGPNMGQSLPTTLEDCLALAALDGRKALLGHYGASLWFLEFAYLRHPPPFDFLRGVMACEYAPETLRNDPELLLEFPPRLLPGLGVGVLWHPTPYRPSL